MSPWKKMAQRRFETDSEIFKKLFRETKVSAAPVICGSVCSEPDGYGRNKGWIDRVW